MIAKPILCLDFDGVLHSYTSGWKGPAIIPDNPVPGAIEFVTEAVNHFVVHVFSSRSHHLGARAAMKDWMQRWGFPVEELIFPCDKPPALVTLDDRAMQFTGVFPDPEELLDFKPWHRK